MHKINIQFFTQEKNSFTFCDIFKKVKGELARKEYDATVASTKNRENTILYEDEKKTFEFRARIMHARRGALVAYFLVFYFDNEHLEEWYLYSLRCSLDLY